MPLYTLHRNFLLRTTKGASINFKKGEPTHVPPICVPDVVAIGAQPVDEVVDVLPEEEVKQIPLTPAQRKDKIFAALNTMVSRNERSDFTASGTPNAKKLVAMVGFDMSTKERDEAWTDYRQTVLRQEDD